MYLSQETFAPQSHSVSRKIRHRQGFRIKGHIHVLLEVHLE